MNDEKFNALTAYLRKMHRELIEMERNGTINADRENPVKIGEYLTRLRLNANLLFGFSNKLLDILNTGIRGTAEKRQAYYEAQIESGKTASAAEAHAKEMTRVDEVNNKIIENQISIIKNEYERYNGICMSLQSRMKEFDTERRMQ